MTRAQGLTYFISLFVKRPLMLVPAPILRRVLRWHCWDKRRGTGPALPALWEAKQHETVWDGILPCLRPFIVSGHLWCRDGTISPPLEERRGVIGRG